MLPVEILPVQESIVLRARGSELLILPHHVQKLKGLSKARDFSQYFRGEALVNRPARKLFEAWLRKDHTLWPRLYQVVHKEMDLVEGAVEGDDAGAKAKADVAPVASAAKAAETAPKAAAKKDKPAAEKTTAKAEPKSTGKAAADKAEAPAAKPEKKAAKVSVVKEKKATTEKATIEKAEKPAKAKVKSVAKEAPKAKAAPKAKVAGSKAKG